MNNPHKTFATYAQAGSLFPTSYSTIMLLLVKLPHKYSVRSKTLNDLLSVTVIAKCCISIRRVTAKGAFQDYLMADINLT